MITQGLLVRFSNETGTGTAYAGKWNQSTGLLLSDLYETLGGPHGSHRQNSHHPCILTLSSLTWPLTTISTSVWKGFLPFIR